MENINIYRFSCLRCQHQWSSKQDRPRVCPKCKSPYWDTLKDEGKKIKPLKIDWSDKGPVFKERKRRIKHNQWGRWKYNPSTHSLDIRKNVGGHVWAYDVDLERCDTGAKLLDWIYQVQGKNFISPDDVADLVYAADDILCNVQSNLCSGGKNLTFDVAKHLTQHIDPLFK